MAETTKEQAKNSQIRSKNTEQTLQSEKGITAEHEKQAKFTEQEIAAGIDYSDLLDKEIGKLQQKAIKENDLSNQIKQSRLEEKHIKSQMNDLDDKGKQIAQQMIDKIRARRQELGEEYDLSKKATEAQADKNKLIEKSEIMIRKQGDMAKNLGDKIEGFFNSIGGESLVKALGIENFGNTLQQEVMSNLMKTGNLTNALSSSFGVINKQVGGLAKRLYALVIANPITALTAAAVGLFMMFRKIGRAQRELANELSFSKDQLDGQLASLKLQEAKFKVLNLDADKLKGTLTTLSEEFRDLSLVTAENAANIEQFAQNAGIAGTEVAKLNKKLMVMEGLSFDAALSMQRQAAAMAKAEGLAVGRVLNDMATAAEDFARFSRDGADGLAEAAVAAAKLGLSLDGVLKASEGLLDFESSITKEFEAQVLTGQALNLERARQAALAGDQEGLLQEIRSIAMGVNVESMNVIQKDAIAGAIGISVADLMRVSRGESLDKQQTQIDLQKKTNDILINGFTENTDELKKIEENQKQGGPTNNNLTGIKFEVSA
jgi:hypothetical protein